MIKFLIINLSIILIIFSILILIPQNSNSHPILFIIFIIIYRILISLRISIWKSNFIYSIIIFLIIIRGLLIIFLYFSRLISNEQIILNINKIIFYITILNFSFIYLNLYIKNLFLSNLIYKFKETSPLTNVNEKIFINITQLYTYPYNNLTIICIIFLLISLFTIIKLSSTKSKPLRKISN